MRAPFTVSICKRVALILAVVLAFSVASAQMSHTANAFVFSDNVYIEAAPLARALGVVAYADAGALTWRGPFGPVTLFASSSSALAQVPGQADVADVLLAGPVLELNETWFVPLDALPLLGVDVPTESGRPAVLDLPDGRMLELTYVSSEVYGLAPVTRAAGSHGGGYSGLISWEPLEEPLAGVRFFDDQGVSLLIADLALVPLAQPQLMTDVDRALERAREAGTDHVLLLMVTSVGELPWSASLTFVQDDRRIEVRPPYRMLIESGDAELVLPDQPVMGAVLLPNSFSMYRPMFVTWSGGQAEVQFRR